MSFSVLSPLSCSNFIKALYGAFIIMLIFPMEGSAMQARLRMLQEQNRIRTQTQSNPITQKQPEVKQQSQDQSEPKGEIQQSDREVEESEKREQQAVLKEEDPRRRLIELEEENRRAAEKRKAQSSIVRPIESTDQSRSYQEGQSLASSLMGGVSPSNPENVPGYQGTDLSQSQIQAHDLGDEALKVSRNSEAAQLLTERFEKGEKFVIDPHTDPLIMAGNEIIADPQKALDESIIEDGEEVETTEEIKTCEESGDETLETVEEIRMVTVAEPPKHISSLSVYSHGWSGGLSRNVVTGQKYDGSTSNTPCYAAGTTIGNPLPANLQSRFKSVQFSPGYSCPGGTSLSSNGVMSISTSGGGGGLFGGGWKYVSFTTSVEITLKPGEEDISENIITNGHNLDERVEKGLCSYEEIIVVEGPQTRVINDYAVTRDWWRRQKVYRCHYPAKNDCDALRAKGCYQVKSACKQKVFDTCVIWEQTYHCPSGKKSVKSYRGSNKENPFCLSGDCVDKFYEPNQDFAQVMSHMSVLKEAGDDLRNFGAIFKGVDRKCTRHCVSFKDCCGNGNGWGVSLKLASCDAEEKELAELRKKKRCIQVGTYCAEKVLGVCIRKKTSFCCYGTKLAKIVQEQGKGQLGLGFGSPEHPECQGLTPEQLSRIDFSQINFSEIFSDIVANTKIPNPEKLISGIQQSMENKGSLLKPSVKEIDGKLIDLSDSKEQPEERLSIKERNALKTKEWLELAERADSRPKGEKVSLKESIALKKRAFLEKEGKLNPILSTPVGETVAPLERKLSLQESIDLQKKRLMDGSNTALQNRIVSKQIQEELKAPSSIEGAQSGNELSPENHSKINNLQIQGHECQGRTHGQF